MNKKLVYGLALAALATTFVGCSTQETKTEPQTQVGEVTNAGEKKEEKEPVKEVATEEKTADATTAASVDGTTSASIVPENFVQPYEPKGFTEADTKKALFVVGDPRKNSVNYDLVNTAMKYFEENGVEVELRDLYDMEFNPVLQLENFFYAKDGSGEPTPEIAAEQALVTEADYIIFCYPNWHDTPNAIVKGYMETVFAKKFAYQDTAEGLQGMLTDKSIYTIMNAGFLGGGRGYIGDGVGINDAAWEEYMAAYEVFDNDTAGFWGVENKGRFVNDRTPKNNSENYEAEIAELRTALEAELKEVFFN